MIDSRFGLKYSFPHSLVHIVDNSANTGTLGVTETYDPSLLATIVVTGMPMGVNNRIVTVTRSDVLNKAFGAETLTASDIEKYGQSVEYPTSLISQNVPVKLLRITPPDAQYGVVVLYLFWRILDTEERRLEVKLVQAVETDLASAGINLAAYKNTERLAKATFTRLKSDTVEAGVETATDANWHRVVLMTYVSAGTGSAYNNFSVYINKPSYAQRKKFANAIYNFGTLDNRYSTALEIEKFTASLINYETKLSAYGVTSNMDTVNVQMNKRLEGSSIMIPYVNEQAIKEVFAKWQEVFNYNRENRSPEYTDRESSYEFIYNDMNVNKFDIIFGKYLYNNNGVEIDNLDIPFYTVDMLNSDIPQLDKTNIIVEDSESGRRTDTEPNQTTSNEILGAIFDEKIYPYWNDLYGRNQVLSGSNTGNIWEKGQGRNTAYVADGSVFAELNGDTVGEYTKTINVEDIYNGEGTQITDTAKREQVWQKDKESIKKINNVVPGQMYLVNADTTMPSISIISSIQQFTGACMSVNIPKLYNFTYTTNSETNEIEYTIDKLSPSTTIKKVFKYTETVIDDLPDTTTMIKFLNDQIGNASGYTGDTDNTSYGTTIAVTYTEKLSNIKKFKLYRITGYDANATGAHITSIVAYPNNYYACLNYDSYYNKSAINDIIVLRSKVKAAFTLTTDEEIEAALPGAYFKYGTIVINDLKEAINLNPMELGDYTQSATGKVGISITSNNLVDVISYFEEDKESHKLTPVLYDVTTYNQYRGSALPPRINNITTNMDSEEYDYIYLGDTVTTSGYDRNSYTNKTLINLIGVLKSIDTYIKRYRISSMSNSTFRLSETTAVIPANYYIANYGISPESEQGGMTVIGGTTGFFDDYEKNEITSIEFKLRYSDLLVQAFKGELDPRILSPARVPAKFLFDGGFNTVLGIKALPFSAPTIEDYVYASTIFTDEEKEEFAANSKMIAASAISTDIDVKQAMYDLMIQRCYMGIPESKRPIGPGSGLSLHLDSGFCDIEMIKKMNESFRSRFTNPNASWDIGGYTSALNGQTYTYTKRLVDHMFDHIQRYTINKPFVNTYTTIGPDEYTSFFPDIDTTDWDLEELLYTSGGNSWVLDESRSLKRKSQRTLYREETGTSDLLQESNMRTLSRLVYLLQNKIDRWLLEYVDDGILSSMTETVNNIFSGWAGNMVQALDIQFERDTNTDGGEIVVCYVNVTFRGLLLRVPIIVNVNRRES